MHGVGDVPVETGGYRLRQAYVGAGVAVGLRRSGCDGRHYLVGRGAEVWRYGVDRGRVV